MVTAYWICNRHPLGSNSAVDAAGLTWQRVEAHGDTTGRRNELHIMSRERIGQRRGVPLLAPVLESLKQLGRYTDAEITAAVISAMFTVFVKSQNPSDGRPFGEMIPAEELIDNADQSSIELGPGAIIDLNPGEEVQFADPKHPNTGYDDFTNATIRLIGAGLEIPPEVMMKQFTTSYSAARGALNEFWRTCSMQRDWFTDDFCQPVYEEWFAEAVARGRIHALGFFTDPARRKAYTACVERPGTDEPESRAGGGCRHQAGGCRFQHGAGGDGANDRRGLQPQHQTAHDRGQAQARGGRDRKSADGGRIGGKQKCPKTRNSGNSAIRQETRWSCCFTATFRRRAGGATR